MELRRLQFVSCERNQSLQHSTMTAAVSCPMCAGDQDAASFVLSCRSSRPVPSHPASRHIDCWAIRYDRLYMQPKPCNLANTSLLPPSPAELNEYLEPGHRHQP